MTIYSYKNKEMTCYILLGPSRYTLILAVYSFLTELHMLVCLEGEQSFWF